MSTPATPSGYRVNYYGRGSTRTDITSYVESINKMTDVGNGEIPTAQIMLYSIDGEFVTNSNMGKTPIISQYDSISVTFEDNKLGLRTQWFFQDDVAPQKNETGRHVVLELVGWEAHLQKVYFTGYYPFRSMKAMLTEIADYYNAVKGDNQPPLRYEMTSFEQLPTYTWGTFEFGGKTTVYDALQEVIQRLGLPVAAGGAGERYSITSNSVHIGFAIQFAIFLYVTPRGTRTSGRSTPTITAPMNLTRIKSPEAGNIVVVEGQHGAGSYPRQIAEMRGLIEEYENVPEYNPTTSIPYPAGAHVQYLGNVWRALTTPSTVQMPPPASSTGSSSLWEYETLREYITRWEIWRFGSPQRTFQYSPWTQDKARVIRNWGGKPYGGLATGFTGVSFPDSNLVVREGAVGRDNFTVWRDWVDFKVDSAASASNVAGRFGGAAYDGMRCVCIGDLTPPGATGSRDQFNKPYANAMCQYWQGKWIVFRTPQEFDQCCVLVDGETWEYSQAPGSPVNGKTVRNTRRATNSGNTAYTSAPSGIQWRNNTSGLMGNDAFHYPATCTNVPGLIGADVSDGSGTIIPSTFTQNSAIQIQYRHLVTPVSAALAHAVSTLEEIGATLWNLAGTALEGAFGAEFVPVELTQDQTNKLYEVDTYNQGWWITLFEAPYPKTNDGISEDPGALYSPPLLDTHNWNLTPTGGRGYGVHDSDMLGELDGIAFFFDFNIEGLTLQDLQGNIPFRCFIYDIFGGVFKSDFMIRFQNEPQFIRLPFSSFSNYRSRLPVGYSIANWFHKVKNPELLQTDVLQTHYIKRIGMHCLLGYDDQGRYDPYKVESWINIIVPILTNTTIRYTGTIDALHFTKAPMAIERGNESSDRHTMDNVKEYPNVSNVIQLQKIAKSEIDISEHQPDRVEFQIDDQIPDIGMCSMLPEQTIRITDDAFIADNDISDGEGGTLNNTREYIVDKITYSAGDRSTGSGLVAHVIASRKVAT